MNKPANIPESSKFLEGTGDSAWFYIQDTDVHNEFVISRYTTEGIPECRHIFTLQNEGFNISEDFEFTWVSHCTKCNILQNKKRYLFIKHI